MQPAVPNQQQERRALHARVRRHQQRRQRQLLLQRHKHLEPGELIEWAGGLTSDLAAAAAPHTSSYDGSSSSSSTSSSSVEPAASHRGNAGELLGLAGAPGPIRLQARLRRLLVHLPASEAAPGASRTDQPDATSHRDSSSAESRGSVKESGSVAPAPVAFAPVASSSAAPAPAAAASSSHHLQATGEGAGGVGQAPAGSGSAAASEQAPEVWHPCLHEGFAATYDRLAYDGAAPSPAQVLLRGRSSWRECLALVDAVVDASAPCQVSAGRPACRLGIAQPEHSGSFLALTGFYVVAKFLQVPRDAPLGAVLDASKGLCSRPWSWVSEHLGHNINVERYCTWGPYVVKLLRQGLQLKDSAVRVGSGDVGWPLGAALAEASKLPDMMGRASYATNAKLGRSRKEQAAWAESAVAAPATQKHSSSSKHRSADQQRPASSATQVAGTSRTPAADGLAAAAQTAPAPAGTTAAPLSALVKTEHLQFS
ncbi:hypothetical protein COO60DRAFT_658166 [Scenedesmus sp. NREL 46B-D3]|nr:hypothetical protein COO60DRAFT_658166 [Scenedesmus sp. NREL 46B-D3]